ncbi:hypothetical protein F4212_05685 [Candidatus Poribacteria bacterium]|nr:hypothetical protein [Candidatus Poribacteria bacterium]
MNMKQIAIIFSIILIYGVQPLFAQTPESPTPIQEEDKSVEDNSQITEPTSQSTQEQQATTQENQSSKDEEQETENDTSSPPEEIPTDSNEQDMISTIEEIEEPPDPALPKWRGERRLFKIVNDYLLEADEVMTTLVLIAGNATIQGTVTGNVLVIGGDVDLAPGSEIKGMLQVIGGHIYGNLESVAHISVNNGWRIAPAAAQLLMHPHTLWDIKKHRNFRLTSIKFGILLLTYLLIAIAFPRPINAISSMLANRPIGSILFGLIMFVVVPVVSWVLILSIVGFPFLLLGIFLLVPLALCGKTAIFYTLGSTLLAGRLRPLAVIFGFIPYFMATEIPHVDWVTFLVFNGVGIGICILSTLNAMSSSSQTKSVHWSERIG